MKDLQPEAPSKAIPPAPAPATFKKSRRVNLRLTKIASPHVLAALEYVGLPTGPCQGKCILRAYPKPDVK